MGEIKVVTDYHGNTSANPRRAIQTRNLSLVISVTLGISHSHKDIPDWAVAVTPPLPPLSYYTISRNVDNNRDAWQLESCNL